MFFYKKQIFHVFLFNIRNYSPKLVGIQRREVELNILLPSVTNFDIKQNGMEYLLYYRPPAPSKIWEDKANETQQISAKTKFVKTELRHIKLQLLLNHSILRLLIFLSEIISS